MTGNELYEQLNERIATAERYRRDRADDGGSARVRAMVGRKVASARVYWGLNQTQFAQAIGLSQTAISHIERGKRALAAEELADIAFVTGHTADWFLEVILFPEPEVTS